MQKNHFLSSKLFAQAQNILPGGVNSPVRAFKGVGGTPCFFAKGQGAYVYDVDGNEYIDYLGAWGPLILGHAHPSVTAAVHAALNDSFCFGAPTPSEVTLAELIIQHYPSIAMVRMVNSGTEATMSAIRLARGYTHRKKIVKFDSCYHGHADSLLVKSGSGILTCGIAGSAGVLTETAEQTIVVPYNDLAATQEVFARYGDDIAAIIVEPIAANNNLILPVPGFLSGLRALCDKYQSLLIFDEVITGYRVALGGAQQLFGVQADLTCLGKIIGGGMPVGAFGGRKDVMQLLAPLGPVYQAGTMSGNPIAMHAGIATILELQNDPAIYNILHTLSHNLMHGLQTIAATYDFELTVNYSHGLFGYQFIDDPDNCMFKQFYHLMLDHGVYLAPSAYEAGFMSNAHNDEIIETTLTAAKKSFAVMQSVVV